MAEKDKWMKQCTAEYIQFGRVIILADSVCSVLGSGGQNLSWQKDWHFAQQMRCDLGCLPPLLQNVQLDFSFLRVGTMGGSSDGVSGWVAVIHPRGTPGFQKELLFPSVDLPQP